MRALILLFLFLLAMPASAAEPMLRGEYQKWMVYDYAEPAGPVCYAMTRAERSTDLKGKTLNPKGRGQVLLQVTRRTAEGGGMVFSYVAGHSIKQKTDVLAVIGKSKFRLKSNGDTAWTASPADDAAMISALRKAKTLSLSHQDRKGTLITDAFSVKGVSAALSALNNCQ